MFYPELQTNFLFLFECFIYCICFLGYRCLRKCGGRSTSLHLEVASWISLRIQSRWVRQGLCCSSTAQNFILSNVHTYFTRVLHSTISIFCIKSQEYKVLDMELLYYFSLVLNSQKMKAKFLNPRWVLFVVLCRY